MYSTDEFDLGQTVSAVLAGDRDAYRLIVRKYAMGIRAFVASQLYHLDDADDLAQDVFVTAFKNLSHFRLGEDLGNWLRGIARNKLKMHFRSLARRQSAMERFREQVGTLIESNIEEATAMLSEDKIERLLHCISNLPDKMRRIVRAGLEGQRAAELSDELEMSVGALYTMNHRANKLLRECMEKTA